MSEPRALGRYFYGDRLPGQARRFYDVLDSRLAGADYRAEVPLTLEERDRADRDAFAACKALRHDRPEYFFSRAKNDLFFQRRAGRAAADANSLYACGDRDAEDDFPAENASVDGRDGG